MINEKETQHTVSLPEKEGNQQLSAQTASSSTAEEKETAAAEAEVTAENTKQEQVEAKELKIAGAEKEERAELEHQQLIVKVCGMTQSDNIKEVEALGIDWMGFICFPPSPRCVTTLPDYLPRKCRRVGVFVNPTDEWIGQHTCSLGLEIIQFHGNESPEQCRFWQAKGYVIIKALPVATADDLQRTAAYEGYCDYLLFDTKTPLYGGSGASFDWQLLNAYTGSTPFLLSGGIGPENVDALLQFHHPRWAGVDLNSRFELSPGVKQVARLSPFIQALREHHSLPNRRQKDNSPTQS